MEALKAPPEGSPAWVWGLFYVFAIVSVMLLFWRLAVKPKAEAKPASPEAVMVAGAFGSPNEVRLIREVLQRVEAHVEVGNALTDDVKDALRDLIRAVAELRESNERTGARAADTLARNADEVRRAADLVGKIVRKEER